MATSIPTLLSAHPVDLAGYESLYKSLHSNPDLSLQEAFAAGAASSYLRKLNSSLPAAHRFQIHEKIGGHGLAAVLRNGAGPTVLLRADMDALPVEEKTGLEYASTKRQVDVADGVEKPVMHACGHDFHVTALLAAAEKVAKARESWVGTLVLVFQPNEERAGGAKAMVEGGLYGKVPVPDVVLGQHVMPAPTGSVLVRSGTMMAAADSFKVTLFGRGGHGSMPQKSIDPVVLASHVVVRLQGIVSREVDPAEPAVVTVGALQAGETENVIADRAMLKLNVRSQSEGTRKRILGSIERIIRAECQASGCETEPIIEETTSFPMTMNDPESVRKLSESFESYFGKAFVPDPPASNASEDVSILATSVGKPSVFWFFGGISRETWDRAEKEGKLDQLPSNHSSFFAPVIQPTLKVGVDALCVGALTFLGQTSTRTSAG